MSSSWLAIFVAGSVLGGAVPALAAAKASAAPGDPVILSVYPLTAQRGATFIAALHGNGLRESTGVFAGDAPLAASLAAPDPEQPDSVQVSIAIAPEAKPGRYPVRLVTPRGISNAVILHIVDLPVSIEPPGPHETPDAAILVDKLPAIYNGRIARRGESDYYAFDVKAGQTVTFEAISGLPSTGAAGGNAQGFDPSISVYEPSGSWFDPKRVNRVAFNDEPLWVLGQLTDSYLVHKFEKGGRRLIRIEAFSGQGGPDYGYELKILTGEAPQDRAPASGSWEERTFTRQLSANRLNQLAERGGKAPDEKSIESYGAGGLFKIPGTLEGALTKPGEAQRVRFHLDGPQDIAIEVETPSAAPPLFNPIVRLLNAAGDEVATSISVGRGACNGEMNKSIQAKTVLPLRDPGDYTVEIRDTTSDLAGADFHYRVQVRPQVPHIGQVNIAEDHINLAPGAAKTVRVSFDREEGYTGAVAVTAESLPEGVQALAGADFEPDKDPPRFASRRERYTPRTERVVVIFTASEGAPILKQPQIARLVVRSIVDGKPGAIVGMKQIPLMVVAKP